MGRDYRQGHGDTTGSRTRRPPRTCGTTAQVCLVNHETQPGAGPVLFPGPSCCLRHYFLLLRVSLLGWTRFGSPGILGVPT
ncbi:hypothetical protein ASD11_07345 [Aeromicrobium sp. Root495]|nr:hypothetical protein ASD11_07345 [Aeromicrobium sp. Root495]